MESLETIWIPLPCGTRLAARLWLPDAPGPAILEALPYRRRDVTSARDASVYPALAERGFAGVRVDLRGTGDSEGTFDDEYSETELSDIEAVIAWIASQPWCSGKVGMMGISWGGFNSLQVASRRPEALGAVISIASTVDRFADDIHTKGGAQMGTHLYWATQMLGRAALPPDAAVVGPDWRDRWLARLEALPALAFTWMGHQQRDDYWRHGSICEDFGAVEAPALMIAGWADGYRNTPWAAREGLGDKARSITGPWVHLYPHFATPGPRMDYVGAAEAWFGQHLRGDNVRDLPAHRLWLSEGVRPDQRDREPGQWISIDQSGGSEQLFGLAPGRLVEGAGGGTARVQTPLDCGGAAGEYFTQGGLADLPGDQRADDGMSVCFETASLDAPLDIIGRPVLRARVALDAPQGNLIVRLCDVRPDGTSHRISLGVLNLSHRGGSAAPRPMVPGVAEDVEIALDVSAYRVLPGHRLRLAVSTQYFPYVLPPRTEVVAEVDLGASTLHLPLQPFETCEVPEGTDTRPEFPREGGYARRTITQERGTGRTTLEVASSGGVVTQAENGMVFEDVRLSRVGITRGDPLSLEAEELCSGRRVRDGVETLVEARGRLRATATHWVVTARIEAFEDGEKVFERNWAQEIPRDHV